MQPPRRPATLSLPDHPAAWLAAARDAGRPSTPCPKCQGYVEVSYDPGFKHTRRPSGARRSAPLQPESTPAPDSPWKGFSKGPDTTVAVQAVDLPLPLRESDRPPQRRIFQRCWNCGWGELLFPEPRSDVSPSPDLPWRAKGRVYLHTEQRWVTRAQLAVKAGLSPSYLSEVLAGTKRISVQAAERLAAAAGIDPRKVLGSATAAMGRDAPRDWVGFLEAQAVGLLDGETDAARTGVVTGRTERVRLPLRPRRRQPATIHAPGQPLRVLKTRADQRGHTVAPAAQRPPCEGFWQITDASRMPKPWDSIQLDSVRRYLDRHYPY